MPSTVPDDVEARIQSRVKRFVGAAGINIMLDVCRAEFLDGYARGMQVGHWAILLPPSSLDDGDICGVCA